MKTRILLIATGALLSMTASAFAVPTITYPNPVGSGTCTITLQVSSNTGGDIEGVPVSDHILVATKVAAGDPCNPSANNQYGQGFIGKLTVATGVSKTGAIVGSYNANYGVSYVTVISWPLPKVSGTGTIDTFLNSCQAGGTNCYTLTYGGAYTFTRTH